MDGGLMAARSPSFNSYSNTRFITIADRVVEELVCDGFYFEADSGEAESERRKEILEEDIEMEFEFGVVARDSVMVRPIYPVFGRDMLLETTGAGEGFRDGNGLAKSDEDKPQGAIRRQPLRKLFIDERETTMTSSCSSSETDDLDGVWRPKESAVSRCKNSRSTGAHQQRWMLKVKKLLHRSHSDVNQDDVVIHRRKEKGR